MANSIVTQDTPESVRSELEALNDRLKASGAHTSESDLDAIVDLMTRLNKVEPGRTSGVKRVNSPYDPRRSGVPIPVKQRNTPLPSTSAAG